ncbi:MAG: dihydrolipoyllysine-residue succinyltransferase [Rhodospirillaceae bacterium]|nr:dihydrolipoyllysine-residue succinyltransferase [Rhodospirillaceae bacterium]
MDIIVPQLGESITEATVARWLKKVGEKVSEDEPLVELETDKVTLEVNAPSSGTLADIAFKEGVEVQIGAVLGEIGESKAVASDRGSSENITPDLNTSTEISDKPATENLSMSPAVRKMLGDNNLNPHQIPATGKGGRLTKADILGYLEERENSSSSEDQDTLSASDLPQIKLRTEERVRMTRLRKRIAERLKEAQNNAAILTTFNEVDMTAVLRARNKYRETFEKKHGVRLGFMSFFAKACIGALQEIPAVNAIIDGEDIVYRNYVDLGIAVGTDQGLVVPVLRDANLKSFAEIEKSVGELGKRARAGDLAIQDLTGGTFTITNGGVYGSLLSTPIINPPQSAILGMHKIEERAIAISGEVVIRPMMYLALSYDHRIIDGSEAVRFLVRIKECIEAPERILFDI